MPHASEAKKQKPEQRSPAEIEAAGAAAGAAAAAKAAGGLAGAGARAAPRAQKKGAKKARRTISPAKARKQNAARQNAKGKAIWEAVNSGTDKRPAPDDGAHIKGLKGTRGK